MIGSFEIFKGASKQFKSTLTDQDGVPIDLTAVTTKKIRAMNLLTGAEIFDLDLTTVGAPTLGIVSHDFLPAETATLTPGEYLGQVKLVSGAATWHSPVFSFAIHPVVKV